jgi:hypothetical protein
LNPTRNKPDREHWWQRITVKPWATTDREMDAQLPDEVAKPVKDSDRRWFGVKVGWKW